MEKEKTTAEGDNRGGDALRADLNDALAALRAGGVVVYPTDTVWGIGCDATNSEAVRRIFEIKRRADSKALISLVADEPMLDRWVDDVPEAAWQLIDASAGVQPMTIVYDHPRGLAPELLAADGSAAIRIVGAGFAQRLCRMLRCPLVSTPANRSGDATPATFADIDPEILAAADYVAMTGRDDKTPHTPSSVVKISDGGVIKILRP